MRNSTAWFSSRTRAIALVVILWTGAALLASLQPAQKITLHGTIVPMSWSETFGEAVRGYVWWLVATPLLIFIARRAPLVPGKLARTFAIHVSASLVVAAVIAALRPLTATNVAFRLANWPAIALNDLRFYLPQGIGIYWLVMAVIAATESYRKYLAKQSEAARLNAQLARAELSMLRMQFQPHFLFNSLHAISTLVDWRPADARRMITLLSELLRKTVDAEPRALVPLEEELDWLERYLELQRIRFADRVSIDMQIAPAALNAMVPSFILQPLVENAIKHGVDADAGAVNIAIRANANDGHLMLAVTDDGVGLREPVSEGIGLQNTRRRLQTLYGSDQSFELRALPKGVEALIELPLQTIKPSNGAALQDSRS